MSPPIIIDRRKNPGKKNLSNRQRFIDRFKKQIKESARKHIGKRSIEDAGEQEVIISNDTTEEPKFNHRSDSGEWDYVLPGNTDYIPGDTINKPKQGSSGGRGTEGSTGQTGEDEFSFLLSYDEYLDLIFDDLELPDLIKASQKTIESYQLKRAGFSTVGVPANLNVERTAIAGLSRRIALKTPKLARIADLEEQLENEIDEDKKQAILEEIERLKIRARAIGFLDNVDLRYNNFVPQPRPITQAVMFCVMDVSYSMGEQEKIIAKKFFLLLHLFLNRHYKNIDVVFIRHHETAEECDEETFFTSRTTGGTVVSTAYELVEKNIKTKYNPNDWNIYIAQASDGDNYGSDNDECQRYLTKIMPNTQFMAYIEITRNQGEFYFVHQTSLWATLDQVRDEFSQISLQKVSAEEDVISVFRKFFARK